jgi:DNA-binding NtrC family response regulator
MVRRAFSRRPGGGGPGFDEDLGWLHDINCDRSQPAGATSASGLASRRRHGYSWGVRPPTADATSVVPNTEAGRASPSTSLRLTVIQGRDAGRSLALKQGAPRVRVGTARGCELELHDEGVSPRHLEIGWADGGVRVRDLGSRGGTFIGPVRIIEAIVEPGARVRVGDTVLAFGAALDEDDLRARLAAEGMVFVSAAMEALGASVQTIAPFTMSVLVEGETGTGKEVIARVIHALSMRANGPFVIVDCGALSPGLVESELFGHERGAFTGAEGRRPGAFELAHGGTLFLDEIGELPRQSQASLLGVLQRRRFRRVGGEREISVDVRVVSATNRDLQAEIALGTFREDLFFRLATAHLRIPPLRDRPDDLPALVAHFLRELGGSDAGSPFDAPALRALAAHPFRGNVRELRALVERALATGRIDLGLRPPALLPAPSVEPGPPSIPLPQAPGPAAPIEVYGDARARALLAFERDYLSRLITACEANASEAARVARMDRPHMLRLLRRHGLR